MKLASLSSTNLIGLEGTGPTEYNLATLELWLHDDQKNGTVPGRVVYDHLTDNKGLANHLGLADLLEIQKKGITIFRRFFAGKAVFGWKSMVQNHNGTIFVPFLVEYNSSVVVRWRSVHNIWNVNGPALVFPS